jgi:hypothetical protein
MYTQVPLCGLSSLLTLWSSCIWGRTWWTTRNSASKRIRWLCCDKDFNQRRGFNCSASISCIWRSKVEAFQRPCYKNKSDLPKLRCKKLLLDTTISNVYFQVLHINHVQCIQMMHEFSDWLKYKLFILLPAMITEWL